MKKILTILLAFLITSCTSNKNHHKHHKKKHPKPVYINGVYKRLPPSESMQAGLPKKPTVSRSESNYSASKELYHDLVDNDESKENLVDNQPYTGHFKIGNPYEIEGVAYFPEDYDDYEETGMASWYGDDFHGKATANGEVYDMGVLTAAHPTLPLPSMVRVTNLHNNKSVIVRVNDRGPYAKNRVIDVSEKAARILGFKDDGTTEVKIELLKNETEALLKKLKLKR